MLDMRKGKSGGKIHQKGRKLQGDPITPEVAEGIMLEDVGQLEK